MIDLAAQRFHNQYLIHRSFQSPDEVVASLGAVQAQDYAGAKWALALRLTGCSDADLDQVFAEGHLLRTHVMRPTWHFLTPRDIRWIWILTGTACSSGQWRHVPSLREWSAVDGSCHAEICSALAGGKHYRTRKELGQC